MASPKRGHSAPHKMVVLVQASLHEIHHKTGENMPRPITPEEMDAYGIAPKVLFSIEGFDRQDCLRKLKLWLEAKP